MRTIFRTTLISILSVLMFTMESIAQTDSMDKILSAIKDECASFEYSFSTEGGLKMTGSGTVTVQDKCFRMDGNGLEVWSDGKSIWTVDKAAKEVIIESVDDSGTASSNPAQLLSIADDAFTRQLTTSSMVVLVPKAKSEIKQLKLYMSSASKPVLTKVSATVTDGTVTEFVIKGMKYSKKEPLENFVFDQGSLSKDYMITDLR